MKLTEKQIIDLISEEIEQMLGEMEEPIASGDPAAQALRQEAANWLTSAPGRDIDGAIAIIRQVAKQNEGSTLQEVSKAELNSPKAKALEQAIVDVLNSGLEFTSATPSKVVMAIVDKVMQEYKQRLLGSAAVGGFFESKELKLHIDQPDETLDLEIQHIRMGYKERYKGFCHGY